MDPLFEGWGFQPPTHAGIIREWNIMIEAGKLDVPKYISNPHFVREYKRQPGDVMDVLKRMSFFD